MDREFYNQKVHQLKNIVKNELERGNVDRALKTIDICARILYEFNQTYVDHDLESFILKVSGLLLGKNVQNNNETESRIIMFYDGFGLDNRGLAHIYLKAICKEYEVLYVSYERRKKCIPNIDKLLDSYGSKKVFIKEGKRINQIAELRNIIDLHNPSKLIMYTFPNDTVGTTVFAHYSDKKERYQVNLTDHAFWLGLCSMDKCIEFRDYGATISHLYRNIEFDKIVKLPFYPSIDYECEFEGFPFKVEKEKPRVVFSGGALYKTFGDHNKYYKIVEYILKKYPDIVFWYAGSGDHTEIDKLIKKYPKRVYLTQERKDLYQVLKHCDLYLSTYPISGGLMFQYAAMAGRIPITLKYDEDTEGFLLRQESLKIEFDTVEALYSEINTLLTDDIYKKNREEEVYAAVVREEEFSENLRKILSGEKNTQKINLIDMNVEKFRQEYWKRQSKVSLCEMLIRDDSCFLIKYFPVEYLIGYVLKLFKRIKKFIAR